MDKCPGMRIIMRLKYIKGSEDYVAGSEYTVNTPEEYKGTWNALFNNGCDKKINLEIGMGKGNFITALARLHPDMNYIGIERYSSVLLKAVKKRESMDGCRNLLFLCADAAKIDSYFSAGEVSKIYLNFSDPWPKERHAKRRLTSPLYLKLYEGILSDDGCVEFKTDNKGLFDYSLEQFKKRGWKIFYLDYNIHNGETPEDKAAYRLKDGQENVMTEYEEKFSAKGNPIMKLTAYKPEEA